MITAEAVEPGDAFEANLRRAAVHSIKAKDGQWSMFFVAFLKHPPGATDVNIVFYDPKVKGEPVNVFQINTSPDAKGVSGSVSFGSEQGFKKGITYDVRLTRLIDGKEEVYARTTIALK